MLTDEGLEALGKVADGHVGEERFPGLVALVANDGQVHQVLAGELAVGGPPVRADSLWRISSTTKPLTAVAALGLVDEGLVDLDEPVDRLLPEQAKRRVLTKMDGTVADTVPARRTITVRDLLNFTFGFGMAAEMFASPEPWPVVASYSRLGTFGPADAGAAPDQDTWIAGFALIALLAQPGERWLYNEGAILAGTLCSRAAGVPFPEVLRSRLPEPLHLGDTAFWTDQPARLATAYRSGPDGLEVVDPPDGQWSHPPRFPNAAAAGLVSTVIVLTLRQFDDPRLPQVHRDIQDAAYAAWRP